MKQRLAFVDGLRGIAACMVVLCHLVGRTSAGWLTYRGYLGVAVFFVLSGFVIAMAVGDRTISLSFLGRFAARRALRLDPPYWASIAVALILAVIATQIGIAKELPAPQTVVAHLLYLQDLLGMDAISTIYWTLAYEIQFYLFLILLLWTRRWFMPLWALAFAASLLENSGLTDIAHSGLFIGYWFAFALGAMTYWVTIGRMRPWMLAAAMLATVAVTPFDHADWLVTAAITAGVIYAAARRDAMSRWLSDRVTQFLGRISYSLYLFHPLLGWTAQSVALKSTDQWTALAIGIAVSIVSAWIAYHVIERRSMQWSRIVRLD